MNPLLPIQNILMLLGALVVVSTFLAWRSTPSCGKAVRLGICVLRAFGIAVLLLPLLNPGQWMIPPKEGDVEWAVLVDRSASMQTADVDGRSRLSSAEALAQEVQKLASSQDKKVSLFTFDGDQVVELPPAPMSSASEQVGTDIAGAVSSVAARYSAGSPSLAGILLLSDGRQIAPTSVERAILLCRATQTAISAVPLGGPVRYPDLTVRTSRRQYTQFKDQELAVSVVVSAETAGNRSTEIKLLNASGTVLESQTLRLPSEGEASTVFSLKKLTPGYHEFWVESPPLEGERNLTNNRSRFGVQVLDETIRVLLVEGNPYWDTKFIAQLLQRERNYVFELIYRLSGDRFFSLAAAEGDQNLSMSQRDVFPGTAEELAEYDLIIFGRSVEGFLDDTKTALLLKWVESGGALVLARGKPVTTDVAALSTLYPMKWDVPWKGDFRWRPTLSGEEVGLFGADLPGKNAAVWNKLPPLHEAHYSGELLPFTQVLVEGVATQGEREIRFPLVASRRFGDGQVVSVNCDDLWRWDFFPQVPESAEIYRSFWLQLLNWTVSYSDFLPGRNFALKLSHQNIEVGKPIRVRVMKRPGVKTDATPSLVISREGKAAFTVTPSPKADSSEVWDAIISLDEPGVYNVKLEMAGQDLSPADSDPLFGTVAVTAPPGELDSPSADPEFLARLAKETGGEILKRETLARIFEEKDIPIEQAEGEAKWQSRWDTWQWLLLMLGFFTGEWFLRRRNGLI